jgi:hypothetical protein
MAKASSQQSKSLQSGILTLRFTKDELEHFNELIRRQNVAEVKNIATFAKQLLIKQLDAEPSSETGLSEFREVTAKLQEAVQKLDARTKKMRNGFADGIGHLLQSCAGWSEDEVKEWREKHMRG